MTVEEFEEFYALSARRLIGQLCLVTGDVHEAQDVVHEAFARAWAHRSALLHDGAPEAWVRITATRVAISRWHRAKRATQAWARLAGQRPAVADEPDLGGLLALSAILRQLPPRQRLVMALHYVCDLSVAQIAEEAGMSTGTVKTHLARGRAAVAARMGDTLRAEDHGA
ncbi:SigE family RNA polymerase sigma factor [Saccharopolyspora shandongensis]|uniref:SigE family RNA polymerase sigma factor n=1 Tax=Saccharopolyspora shandongensis TaxID=418495 RepID=UPI0033F9E659